LANLVMLVRKTREARAMKRKTETARTKTTSTKENPQAFFWKSDHTFPIITLSPLISFPYLPSIKEPTN
jgi:hypothetical protein